VIVIVDASAVAVDTTVVGSAVIVTVSAGRVLVKLKSTWNEISKAPSHKVRFEHTSVVAVWTSVSVVITVTGSGMTVM
jgi:hypothetical protein